MHRLAFILIVVFALGFGLLVGALNPARVSLDLLWVQLEWPLGLLVLVGLSVGLAAGMGLIWLLRVVPLSMRLKRAREQAAPLAQREPAVPDD